MAVPLTDAAFAVYSNSLLIAGESGAPNVGMMPLMLALCQETNGLASRLLKEVGITSEKIAPYLGARGQNSTFAVQDLPATEEFVRAFFPTDGYLWDTDHSRRGTGHVLLSVLDRRGREAELVKALRIRTGPLRKRVFAELHREREFADRIDDFVFAAVDTVTVDAPRARVAELIDSEESLFPPGHPDFIRFIGRVPGTPDGVGAVLEYEAMVFGRPVPLTVEVVEHEPGRKYVHRRLDTLTPSGVATSSVELDGDGPTTEVTVTIRATVNTRVEPFMTHQGESLRATSQRCTRRYQQIFESDYPSTGILPLPETPELLTLSPAYARVEAVRSRWTALAAVERQQTDRLVR